MNRLLQLLLIGLLGITATQISAQCTPPSADNCEDANVLCSLDEVNGYTCSNPNYSNPTGCSPLCPSGGGAHNTAWWAFVCDGGLVTITITYANCSVNGTGVQMGIWGDCDCAESVACNPNCTGPGQFTITASLTACKTYYLFVDGCSGDVCDFTITTSGGSQPNLSPLGKINNDPDRRIQLCKGACNINFKVGGQNGNCEPTYEWTLDGNIVGGDDDNIDLDFPDEGDFQLCVTAYIGNPSSGSICDQEGPECATIEVRPIPDKLGPQRLLCAEQIPFKWHNQSVTGPGEYRNQFKGTDCCVFDSVVTFEVYPVPEPPNIYHIGCDNTEVYIDPTTRQTFSSCENEKIIFLSKASVPYRCDSSYKLTAVFLDFNVTFREACIGGMLEITPRVINRTKTCGGGESFEFMYKWYLKSDPAKKPIGTDELFQMDKKEDYCLELGVLAKLGTESKLCFFDFCEMINEDDFKNYKVCPKGDLQVCRGKTGIYFIDTILPPNSLNNWSVSNGTILTPNPFQSNTIEVLWNGPSNVGTLCYYYDNQCGQSPECCIDVKIEPSPAPKAGPDEALCGLANKFKGQKDVGGQWVKLSGPGNVSITDVFDDKSDVNVDQYGTYTFVWSESRLGCTGADTVVLKFNDDPKKDTESYICSGNNKDFKVRFQISGGQPAYTVIKGNGTIDASNVYTSKLILNNTKDTVIIRDANGCEFTFIHTYECKCTNSLGEIQPDRYNLCEDGTVVVNYDKTKEVLDLNPADTVIFFICSDPNNPLATKIRDINSFSFGYDPSFVFGQTYYIGAILGRKDGRGGIDALLGCLSETAGTEFTFYQIPTPQAGPDDAVCGSVYDLKGIQSIPGSDITWKVISGNGALFTDAKAAGTQVSAQSGFGKYRFEIEESNKGICIRQDVVEITFNESPAVINVIKDCVLEGGVVTPDGKFVVIADINGGTPPYTLLSTGGKIIGNKWFSDTLLSITQFTIQVQDANGCISLIVVDDYNCKCGIIDPGKLDTSLLVKCEDQCYTIAELLTNSINEVIDPEDGIMYILHRGNYTNAIDTFYSLNDVICFDSKNMVLGNGNTYYVSRVVGDDVLPKDGIIDTRDPCKRVSNNRPITWEPYPLADAGAPEDVCGLTYNFKANLTLGTGTWKLISGPGTAAISNVNLASSSVTVSQYGAYTFEWGVFNFSCDRYDTVRVVFHDSPDLSLIDIECDNTAENARVIIRAQKGDQPTWVLKGAYDGSNLLNGTFSGNVWTSDWFSSNTDFTITIEDQYQCNLFKLPGDAPCACITALGTLDKTPIILCADGQANAKYTVAPGVLDGNDVVRYMLYDGSSTDPKNGTSISVNSDGKFVFDPSKMQLGKTYYISVFIGNLDPNTGNVNFTDRCALFDVVPVTWYAYPVAAINGNNILTCAVTSLALDGLKSTSGSGSPLNFAWSTQNGRIVGPANTGTSTIDRPGIYVLDVTDPISGCKHQTSFEVKEDVVKPTVAIAPPNVLTCAVTSINLDGNGSSRGAIYGANWSGPGTIIGGATYSPTVSSIGRYTIVVTNTQNGCKDSTFVTVTEDKLTPVPLIEQKGTLTCTVNEVQLDGSKSRGLSGNINNYSWDALTGNIISGQGSSQITVGKPGGTFRLTVRDGKNGCTAIDTITVDELGNPLAQILSDPHNPKCFGDRNGFIDINGVLDKNNQSLGNIQYSINGGPYTSSPNFTNLTQGSYTIKVKDINGCTLETRHDLIEPGKMGIKVIKSIVVDQGTLVDLDSLLLEISGGTQLAGGGYKDTTWLNLDQNIDWENKLRYAADTSREFLITGFDKEGCEISERVRVLVRIIKDVWWPTVISGNGDGVNDFFNLYGKRVRQIKLLEIYDRWGSRVYSQTNIPDGNKGGDKKGWNGIFKGERALPGVYTFYSEVEYEGSTGADKFQGEFTLLR